MFAIRQLIDTTGGQPPDGAAPAWQAEARCRDGTGALVELFFSEQLDDIATAKAFCQECTVRSECLAGARERREPWGVWGGELFVNGKVVAQKRKRGRPPKVRPPEEQTLSA